MLLGVFLLRIQLRCTKLGGDPVSDRTADSGAVGQRATIRGLDSSEPAVTDVMVAGGLSQLCNIDAPFATLKDMVTRVYRVMWQGLNTMMHTSYCAKRR